MNPYFEIVKRNEIENIEELISLNIPKKYDAKKAGELYVPNSNIDPLEFHFPH